MICYQSNRSTVQRDCGPVCVLKYDTLRFRAKKTFEIVH